MKRQQEHGASLCTPSPSPAAGRVEGPVALRPAATARVTPAPRVPTAARQEACTPSSHRPGQVGGTPAFPCARDCPPPALAKQAATWRGTDEAGTTGARSVPACRAPEGTPAPDRCGRIPAPRTAVGLLRAVA